MHTIEMRATVGETISVNVHHLPFLQTGSYTSRTMQQERTTEQWRQQKKITFPFCNLHCTCVSFCPPASRVSGHGWRVWWCHDSVWSRGKPAVLLTLKHNHNVCSVWHECWDHPVCAWVCAPSPFFNQRASGAEQSRGLNRGPFCRSVWLQAGTAAS